MAQRIQGVQQGFDDPTVTGSYRDKVEMYKGQVGRRDILRLLTDPIKYYGARVKIQGKDTGFYALSLADPNDIAAAEAGNADALARCREACPLFARGYAVGPRWVVAIWWVCSYNRAGRRRDVNTVLPWAFAGERYAQFRSIRQSLPRLKNRDNTQSQTPVPFRRIEIAAECVDENFQKMTITPITDQTAMSSTYEDCVAAVGDFFDPPGDFKGKCEAIEEVLLGEGKMELERSLDRAEGRGKFTEPGAGGDEFDHVGDGAAPDDGFGPLPGASRRGGAPAPAQRPAAQRPAARPAAGAAQRPAAQRPAAPAQQRPAAAPAARPVASRAGAAPAAPAQRPAARPTAPQRQAAPAQRPAQRPAARPAAPAPEPAEGEEYAEDQLGQDEGAPLESDDQVAADLDAVLEETGDGFGEPEGA